MKKHDDEAAPEGQPPMGDASSSLPPEPPQGDMPDPAMGGGEPPMGPEGGDVPPMDGGDDAAAGGGGEIQSMFDGLNPEHQKAAKSYIQSLEDQETDAQQGGDQMGDAMPPMTPGQQPMQESVVFTKKQVRTLNENFGEMSDELKRDNEPGHSTKVKKNNRVSPFDPPKNR